MGGVFTKAISAQIVWWGTQDLNLHFTDFKSVASANWATSPKRIAPLFLYILQYIYCKVKCFRIFSHIFPYHNSPESLSVLSDADSLRYGLLRLLRRRCKRSLFSPTRITVFCGGCGISKLSRSSWRDFWINCAI